MHGGYGYGKEFHVERYFREARLMRIAPISQEMVLGYVVRARARPAEVLLRYAHEMSRLGYSGFTLGYLS